VFNRPLVENAGAYGAGYIRIPLQVKTGIELGTGVAPLISTVLDEVLKAGEFVSGNSGGDIGILLQV
jgi:hypothetical protein